MMKCLVLPPRGRRHPLLTFHEFPPDEYHLRLPRVRQSGAQRRGVRHPLTCCHCGCETWPPVGASDGHHLTRCLVCPSTDLFVRKDFPQRLGVALVAAGIVGSSICWAYSQLYWTYGVLFATALLDVILYAIVPNALMCYRCHAEYRGVAGLETHEAFNLETHERYRQEAARLADIASRGNHSISP